MPSGGARRGAGRKKGIGISNEIKSHCEKFITELLKNEVIKRKAIKQLSGIHLTEDQYSEGYVYIFKSSDLYKVGYTKSIEQRIKQYRSHSEISPILVIRCQNAFELESLILKKFKSNIAYGTEWFKLNDSQLIELISYLTNQILSNGWC